MVAFSFSFGLDSRASIMTRGDVYVLKKIEMQEKRVARTVKKLKKKLSRTPRNKRAASHDTFCSPSFNTASFCEETNFQYSDEMLSAKRRIIRTRDKCNKRAFCVGELFQMNDEPLSLVVTPRVSSADADLCVQNITKNAKLMACVSKEVCILESINSQRKVLLTKVNVKRGLVIFYAYCTTSTNNSLNTPLSIGLDAKATTRIQKVVSDLLGAKFVRGTK
jgi:hypothetical protein